MTPERYLERVRGITVNGIPHVALEDALEAVKFARQEKKPFSVDDACEWLAINAENYINAEFNEFHHCVEYDGTLDINKLIKDFRKAVSGDKVNE